MIPVRVRCMGVVCILHSVWIGLIDVEGFCQDCVEVSINQDFVRTSQLPMRYVRYLACTSNSRQRDPRQAVFKF
jgi:hypothetical protein